MKIKNNYFFTLREDSKDEESKVGNLLIRSGMLKKAGSGTYIYLPMGLRVLNNIESIVREGRSCFFKLKKLQRLTI